MPTIAEQLAGWLPIRVQWRGADPLLDWCYLGTRRFTEPFFDDTIGAVLQKPFNLLFRHFTGLDALAQLHAESPGLPPTGFVFHLSRCGSTLVGRMLAALEQNLVVSEASPLDWMIRAQVRRPFVTDDERLAAIQWMVGALGQPRWPGAKHYFIKFDAWHTFDLALLERAFPTTPWIFLYRNPVEVLVSHHRQRGGGTVPGMIEHTLPGLTPQECQLIPPDEYAARVLGRICEAALAHKDSPRALFVNYTQLPDAMTGDILRHFRLAYSDQDLQRMRDAARFNAKSPQVKFTPDADAKQHEASENLRALSDHFMQPLYEQLEAVRLETTTRH